MPEKIYITKLKTNRIHFANNKKKRKPNDFIPMETVKLIFRVKDFKVLDSQKKYVFTG